MSKRFAALMIAVSIIFSAIPVFAAYEPADYIALGDSITRGYGLDSPETGCYPAKFAAVHSLEFKNYGIDGQEAKELLASLQNGDYVLSGASVITVSVGSNELLHFIINMIAEEFGVDTSDPDINTALTQKIEEYMSNGTSNEMLIHLSNIEAYLKNNAELNAICDELSSETLPAIAAEIRKQNPDAQLIFNNIYNPYKNMYVIYPITPTTSTRKNIGVYAQAYVDRVNNVFKTTDTYTVADVASVFTKPAYVNASLDMRNMSTFSFDPHPTYAGHNAIKNVLNTLYIPKPDEPEPIPDPDEHIYGDVDNDEEITAADSAIVLQYVLNKGVKLDEEALIRADVTGDGSISSDDSAAILQKALRSTYMMPIERAK